MIPLEGRSGLCVESGGDAVDVSHHAVFTVVEGNMAIPWVLSLIEA